MLGSQQAQEPAALSSKARVRGAPRAHLAAVLRECISIICHDGCQAISCFFASFRLAYFCHGKVSYPERSS